MVVTLKDEKGAGDDNLANPKDSLRYQIFDLSRFVFLCLLIVVPVRMFVAQPFIVNGESMLPNFQDGNYLIVDQISYRMGEAQRGDVVIFRYPDEPSKFYIKRVIGVPGEHIKIDGHEITIDSTHVLDEPYIDRHMENRVDMTLAGDEYFVMGDNRLDSSDSRVWGPLKEEFIVGRALLRLWPATDINTYPGDFRNDYAYLAEETETPAETDETTEG
jgi:signal peptidase I